MRVQRCIGPHVGQDAAVTLGSPTSRAPCQRVSKTV
jgi:hypothetical protein